MKKITIAEAVKCVSGRWVGPAEELDNYITSVVTDSRKVTSGSLYVAIPGARVDGHDYVTKSYESGAVCSLCQKELDDGVSHYILVEDTLLALRQLAQYYRSILKCTVIGITGSVGKTSTKEMVSTVLSEKYNVQKTAGNFNNLIGLPLTVFTIEEEHEIAVLEMGISEFGEMSKLAMIARPDIMLITNIGQCHLENLGSRDGILKAKTECFDYLNDEADVFLNGSDDKLSTISLVNGKRPFFFQKENEKAYAYADNIVSKGLAGSEAILHLRNENGETYDITINVPIAGSHMVTNAVAASMIAMKLGMTPDEIAAGINKAKAMKGRGELIQTKDYLLVDDCYNASPASMKAELELLKESPGRHVAILGDMLELGENEIELHREVGQFSIDKCDVLICIGSLSKYILEGNGSLDGYYFETKEAFLNSKDEILKKGDTILIKASHSMDFEKILLAL